MKTIPRLPACLAAVLIFSAGLVSARSPRKKPERPRFVAPVTSGQVKQLDEGGVFRPVQTDTFMLAEYEFDSLFAPTTEGWRGVDMTKPPGPFTHVDTFRVINGSRSLWCGAWPASGPPLCSYSTLPGYGNNWDDYFQSSVFRTTGDVTFTATVTYDCEPGYDFTYVDYSTDGGQTWVNISTLNGTGTTTVTTQITAPDSIEFRFHFQSDEGWSDEDGAYISSGAFIADDVSISDANGLVDFHDFESESVGDQQTLDGDWSASTGSAFGDFAGLFKGTLVLQEDLCTSNPSYLWGFFNGSPYDYGCGLHPEQKVVPFRDNEGRYLRNEIWSPLIDWNPGGAVPETATSLILDFWLYNDLPLDNLVFFSYKVDALVNGCPSSWDDVRPYYYGDRKSWLHIVSDVGGSIPPGTTKVRIRLICMDLCKYYCGVFGTGACHSHAPLFDRVKLYRVDRRGPIWDVSDWTLFQDNFPTDGSITGTVRCDMALDVAPDAHSSIRPGDSVVVTVYEPNVGLAQDPGGGPAVYLHARSSGGQTGSGVSGDPSRWPVVAVSGGWNKIRMDTVFNDPYRILPLSDEYCADLNDNYFRPPDKIEFYFSAEDANGNVSYWTRSTGAVSSEAEAQAHAMEMQCLPTGASDILYVDHADGWGVQPYFDTVFDNLSVNPDRFDVRMPGFLADNGLGSRAQTNQVLGVYKIIIWSSGPIWWGTIGDGSTDLDKSPDAKLLYDFVDQSSLWNPGLYISGDYVAEEMKNRLTAPFVQLFNYINYNLISADHYQAGLPVSPYVIGKLPGTIFQHAGVADTLVAYGGCPQLKGFDVLDATGNAVTALYYGSDAADGAVVTQETTNGPGMKARVILSGFGFENIRSDRVSALADRVDHMRDILSWFEEITVVTGTDDEKAQRNMLAQNYPNPFNPTTTIRYSIKQRGHVSLKIYDIEGRLVRTLEDGVKEARSYEKVWDGRNDRGEAVSSGIYFYRLRSNGFSRTRKMVLLR